MLLQTLFRYYLLILLFFCSTSLLTFLRCAYYSTGTSKKMLEFFDENHLNRITELYFVEYKFLYNTACLELDVWSISILSCDIFCSSDLLPVLFAKKRKQQKSKCSLFDSAQPVFCAFFISNFKHGISQIRACCQMHQNRKLLMTDFFCGIFFRFFASFLTFRQLGHPKKKGACWNNPALFSKPKRGLVVRLLLLFQRAAISEEVLHCCNKIKN